MSEASATSRGILLFSTAILCFSLMDVVAKWLMERYDPFMVVWARYASQTFWTCAILAPRLTTLLKTRRPGMQILRSALLFTATLCFFNALQHMKLAEAVAVFEVAPLLITAMSVVLLREVVGPRRWVAVVLGLIGALVIIRPGTEAFQLAALLPLAAAFCFAAYTISTRFVGQDEPAATSILYTTFFGAVAGSLFLPSVWTTPTLADAPVLATFGMIGGLGHYLLILAFTSTQASILAPFNYLGLVLSATWGLMFFAEWPDYWTWAGAAIIVGSGLYVWYRENRA